MGRLLLLSIALVALSVAATAAQDVSANAQDEQPARLVVAVPRFGFSIRKPQDDWRVQQAQHKAPGSWALVLTPPEAAGRAQVTVVAQQVQAANTAVTVRDKSLTSIRERAEFSDIRPRTFRAGAQECPGFSVSWDVQQTRFHVEQCYWHEGGFLYTIAIHARDGDFAAWAPQLRQVRDSFRIIESDGKEQEEHLLRTLAARCGSELQWATDWDQAAQRAREDGKLVLVLLQMQTGFDLTDAVTTGPLMDPDVIDLISEHCIPLRFRKGMQAPIVSYDFYGIGPSSFGISALLTEPDGKVVGDLLSPRTTTLHDFLIRHTSDRQSGSTRDEPQLTPAELATIHVRRGSFDAALEALGEASDREAEYLRGIVHRRRREGAAALQALARAQAAGTDPNPALVVEQALVHLGLGKYAETEESLKKLLDLDISFPRRPEAIYQLGLARWAQAGFEAARPLLMDLVRKHPEDRWAWKAAADLVSSTAKLGLRPSPRWPGAATMEFLRTPSPANALASRAEARRDALAFLQKHQRANGAWRSTPDELSAGGYETKTLTAAVTAICGASLLHHRQHPGVDDSIRRAVSYLRGWHLEDARTERKRYYMDYSPWGDSYTLSFLCTCIDAGLAERSELQPAIDGLIAKLKRSQQSGGGWSYYLGHTLEQSSSRPASQSISFMTARVVLALLRARETGFDVPQVLTDAGLDCLERMRNPNRTFEYFLWHEREGQRGPSAEAGAAGRGPLCALALRQGGRGSVEEIRSALDMFLRHRASYRRETGKSLMHAAPGGQGSHYLMFDYYWAAAAVKSLPESEQAEYQEALGDLVLHARSAQGSFLDNPINGSHYGTGMALDALGLLE